MRHSVYTHHPLPIRTLNALRPGLDAVHLLPRLDMDELVRKARGKTGLTDFGDDRFREPLGVLISSVNVEAGLSSLGRTIVHKRLLDALVIRLRAEELFRRYPEILDIDLGHVFVIAGLQRTGTTLLHRLIGSDPRVRAPLSWEVLNPVPMAKELESRKDSGPQARVRQARIAQRALQYIAPEFFAIHPVEYDMPEEDILLLDLSFMSQSSEATMHVPTYARWLEEQDPKEAYLYLKKMMQLLHWQNPAENTVLKSPHHMEYIDTILKVFPAATIIQTHRDPQKTMASFISMVCHGAGVFSDEVDVAGYSRHWQRKVKRMIDRSIRVRSQEGETRFIDVAYHDLIDNPVDQLRRIYSAAEVVFDAEAEKNAAKLLQRQTQDKYGRHIYRLEDFGLSQRQIEQDFGSYRKRHAIPFETGGGRP